MEISPKKRRERSSLDRCPSVYKIAKDQKRLRTQEELVAEVREQMEAMGTIATLYVELYESSEERLVGGVIFEDERHYRFVYEDGLLHYEEEKL